MLLNNGLFLHLACIVNNYYNFNNKFSTLPLSRTGTDSKLLLFRLKVINRIPVICVCLISKIYINQTSN